MIKTFKKNRGKKRYKGGNYDEGYNKGYEDGYNNNDYDVKDYDPDGYDEGYSEGKEEKLNEVSTKNDTIIKKETENKNQYIYPIYTDKNLSEDITNRLELQVYNYSKESTCEKSDFNLAPYQIFLKNFISRETPYKSLLIYHGTGVGKTCSAVSIAENFKDIYKNKENKIIILLPDAVRDGWRNNIYNPNVDSNQCTGDSYINDINNLKKNEYIERNLIKDRKKVIKYYYTFYGYRAFINNEVIKLKNIIEEKYTNKDNQFKNDKFNKIIKQKFSNKVLIIDEVHNIRNIGNDKKSGIDSEIIFQGLESIIKNSDNLKLIMLSATPMYNEPQEIIKLLNMMLYNDKRNIINKVKDIFKDDGSLQLNGKTILEQKCNGYISYVRGETPNKFPLRLYPYTNNIIDLNYLKLFTCELNDYQKTLYENSIKNIDIEKEINLGKGTQLMQISNVTYPNVKKADINKDNYINCFGKSAKDNFFKIKNNKYTYKKGADEIFSWDLIGFYSQKIKILLETIKNSEGLIFIYSRFIEDGVIPIILALEQNGYINYSGNNLLNTKNISKEHTNKNGNKFIVITGNKELTKDKDKDNYIRTLLSTDNKNGEKIKIIIGSEVASEGLDLKRIREIHIIDPWYHLNRLEQIVGRGIRYCSHQDIEPEKRNVTLYLYTAIINKCEPLRNCNNSIDFRIYNKAIEKSKNIGNVEKILKENAVDCPLFSEINNIETTQNLNIITSQGKKIQNYKVKDLPYSKICSYQKDCIYKCKKTLKKSLNTKTADKKLLKNIYPIIIKIIIKLFEKQKIWSMDYSKDINIIKEIQNNFKNINKDIINLTINYLIKNKINLTINNLNGNLVQYKNHLTFKVICNNNNLFYNSNIECNKIKRYIPINIIKNKETDKKNIVIDKTFHYPIFFINEGDNYIQLDSISNKDLIQSLEEQYISDLKLNNIFAFNFYNKTKAKSDNALLFQILQPSGDKPCKSKNNNLLSKEDRNKLRISGRGAVKDTFPLPKSGNVCGDGNQSGFIKNPCWEQMFNEYIENLKNDSPEQLKETTIILKFIIKKLFKDGFNKDIETININKNKKTICYIIEFLLRYKENNKDDDLIYYMNYDKVLLPYNNILNDTKVGATSSIKDLYNKIKNNELNKLINTKKHDLFNLIEDINIDKEIYQFGYERLNINEKYTLINYIINKDKLDVNDKYIYDLIKYNFIIKDSDNYLINIEGKNIKKPYAFYIFN